MRALAYPHSQPNRRTARWALRCCALALWACTWMAGQATAATPEDWTAQAEEWLRGQWSEGQAMADADTLAGERLSLRPEIRVGQLDSRLKLAPCTQVEPYLPPGTRLWGRSRIGLRCLDGQARWHVFLPITVQAWGPAWVLKRQVLPGATLTQEDAELAEMDWAASVSPVLADQRQWVGQQAARGLLPGQALRENMVRPAQVFSAGAQVKVRVQGGGFQMSSTGQAMAHGLQGQKVRVRLSNGRIVTGTVRDGQTVVVTL